MKVDGVQRSAIIAIFILLASSLFLWTLAYQIPLRQTVHVGGDLEQRRRFDDDPFLAGVHGSEPGDRVDDPDRPGERLWWWELLERSSARPYRWTTAETDFAVPGAGPGRYAVEVLAGGRPGGAPTTWEAGPELRYEIFLPEGPPRRYRLLASAEPSGDLRLTARTTPYRAPGDPRELGFVLYELRVIPAHGPPAAPAWPQLGWLGLALASVYITALAAGTGQWGASSLAGAGALGAAYVLTLHRTALTLFTPTLAILAALCAAATLVGGWAVRLRALGPGLEPVMALTMAAFALRAAGMLHPHALYSDSGLQANKLFEATLGRVFLTAGLPSDAGGGQAPYLPGPFLALMPLELLFPGGGATRVALVQLGTAMLDSLVVALIWLILRRAGAGRRAALFGATCYLLPVAALESFSVGELANLGGQALALPFIALLAVGAAATPKTKDEIGIDPWSLGARPWSMILLTTALTVALLAHSGVTLSVGALVAGAWSLAMIAWLRRRGGPVDGARLTLAATVALGLALLLYYTAPVYLGTLRGRGGGGGGGAPGAILAETALALLGLAPPARRALALPPLLGIAALTGLGLLWVTRRSWPQAAALRATLAAWWGGTLLTLGLLLVADQGVRWATFLYPGLCLSTAPVLAALWRRGQAGRAVAALTLAAIVGYGLVAWIVQVRDYYHV